MTECQPRRCRHDVPTCCLNVFAVLPSPPCRTVHHGVQGGVKLAHQQTSKQTTSACQTAHLTFGELVYRLHLTRSETTPVLLTRPEAAAVLVKPTKLQGPKACCKGRARLGVICAHRGRWQDSSQQGYGNHWQRLINDSHLADNWVVCWGLVPVHCCLVLLGCGCEWSSGLE